MEAVYCYDVEGEAAVYDDNDDSDRRDSNSDTSCKARSNRQWPLLFYKYYRF